MKRCELMTGTHTPDSSQTHNKPRQTRYSLLPHDQRALLHHALVDGQIHAAAVQVHQPAREALEGEAVPCSVRTVVDNQGTLVA